MVDIAAYSPLQILIATVVAFVIGYIWYGPLFGKFYMKETKMSASDMKKAMKGKKNTMILGFIGTLITAISVATVSMITGLVSFELLKLILVVWIGFVVIGLFESHIHGKTSCNELSLHAGYWLAKLIAIVLLI